MMKKKFILFMLCTGLISGLFFTSCSSPSGTNPDNQNPGNTTDNGNDKGDKLQSSQLSDKLKFDFSDATALFGLKEGDKNIYKLTSSEKIVPAFTWGKEFTEDGYTLSINNIYKSPISEDVIIQFNGYIHHTDLVNYKDEYLGPLVHVDKDGKINSPTVVQIDNYDKTLSIPFEETPTVKFDDNGVAYFIAYDGIFDDATNSKYALFSYNPSTKTRKQLLPYQEQFTYEEFYVINDGKCIILIEKEKSSNNYSVSAVPVHVPSQKLTLLESGKDEIGNITYDKFSDKLYINTIYQESYRNYGLYYICTRNGDVFNIAQEPLASPEINIPHVFGRKSVKYGAWPNRYIDYSTKEFKTDVFLEYLLKEFTHFSYNEKKCILPTTENYYISFEKFKDIEEFKPIYEATKGKINEEAIAALDTGNLRTILLNAYTENGYYDEIENSCGNNSEVTLKHSLLADTLYDKNTGKLVSEDETEASKFFNYCDCGEKHFVIMSACENRYIDNESGYYPEPLPEYLNSDGTINYTKILETFFNSCNVHGKKEFNLDYLETTNNKLFSTDKKNEEALQYVFEDIERACYFEYFLNNDWTGFEDGTNYGKLFVIEGTTSPAFNVSFN